MNKNGSERTIKNSSSSFLLLSKNARKVPPTPWEEEVSLRSGQSARYGLTFDVTEQQRASSFFSGFELECISADKIANFSI